MAMSDDVIMEKAASACDLIFELFNGESTVILIDAEKVVRVQEGHKLATGLKTGVIMPEGTLAREVVRTGKRIVKEVPANQSKFGFDYISRSIPIRGLDGVVCGSLTLNSTNEKEVILREVSAQLKEMSIQTNLASQDIADAAGTLAEAVTDLKEKTQETKKEVTTIVDVIDLIKQIASQTNLLALNAAIEAARVGENGKGFAVVAEEVRKLAQNTGSSVKNMSSNLRRILEFMETISNKVSMLDQLVQHQAAATEEITASMSEIGTCAEQVHFVANNVDR